MNSPPTSEIDLLERANQIAGSTLFELAHQCQQTLPTHMLHAKGWVGQLIEKILGADASNLDQPDFMHLGIELKTIPISPQGKIKESTYICTASIPPIDFVWEQSRVWRKMAKILWVPIETDSAISLAERRVGNPILWSPPPCVARDLRLDWEELTALITLGCFEKVGAHVGKYLQLRPKAASSKTLIHVVNQQGHTIQTVPKGFYLRTKLTQQIIDANYALL